MYNIFFDKVNDLPFIWVRDVYNKDQLTDIFEELDFLLGIERYKDPEQYKKWISGQPQQLEQFKMVVLEQQLVEKLENVLKSKKKVIKFSELANRQV